MLRDWNCGSTWSSRTREDGLKGGEGVALGSKAGRGCTRLEGGEGLEV